jgi:BASS family bile acid:Na+ symporter
MTNRTLNIFPVLALFTTGLSLWANELLATAQPAIVPCLSIIMFMMGLTLKKSDIFRILNEPSPVIVGVALQFLLMPVIALELSSLLHLSPQLTAGMILVGSCAGGTASNVMCYIARGDVALSICMTLTSTTLGVLITPALIGFYLSDTIEVDTVSMLLSMIQLVLIPVVAGSLISILIGDKQKIIEKLIPPLSMFFILVIISIVVALNAEMLAQVGLLAITAVILHNILGIGIGFAVSRLFGFNLRQSQTIAIEVGMQNSGLGVALALQHFSATAALPGALFSIWHNLSGSFLASRWARKRGSIDEAIKDAYGKQ